MWGRKALEGDGSCVGFDEGLGAMIQSTARESTAVHRSGNSREIQFALKRYFNRTGIAELKQGMQKWYENVGEGSWECEKSIF
jgi:hypothetical protein